MVLTTKLRFKRFRNVSVDVRTDERITWTITQLQDVLSTQKLCC